MKLILNLYIKGRTRKSELVIKNLKNLLDNEPSVKGKYELNIIDVKKNPQIANQKKIIMTPVLEKESPSPQKRIVGDLNDKEKVLTALGVQH